MKWAKYFVLALMIASVLLPTSGFQSTPSIQEFQLTPELEKLIDKKTSRIILLYGTISIGCPIGNYIHSIKDREDIFFVVPPDYTMNEVDNLRRGLSIKGRIIRASNQNIELFVKKIAKHLKLDKWKWNFILEINNRKITNIKKY